MDDDGAISRWWPVCVCRRVVPREFLYPLSTERWIVRVAYRDVFPDDSKVLAARVAWQRAFRNGPAQLEQARSDIAEMAIGTTHSIVVGETYWAF